MIINQDYQGMRWYKCDLHLHTPEDARHWQDSSIRIQDPRNEADIQEKARLYLKQCHRLGLECIAVTDHNFSTQPDYRKWFLTHLVGQNETIAGDFKKNPLVIFPGFELDICYHVLCLFEPVKKERDLQRLSEILTTMDLPVDQRMKKGKPQQPRVQGRCLSLKELLNKVQNDSGGIVIAAHAFSNDGIFNNPSNTGDFIDNPDLYAVEVNQWPLTKKPNDMIMGHNRDWRRPAPYHQPTPIRSSDAKQLKNSTDQSQDVNYIGKRFSWIKMSQPSIESLRQAFLDPGSRICLENKEPKPEHAHIVSISINGLKFLEDQVVHFSPHLNCIIGGRGSGKSMLFESLRLALRGEMHLDLSEDSRQAAAVQINRLWNTFTGKTHIEAAVSHEILQDIFVADAARQPAQVQNRQVDDPPTVFRNLTPLIFSQEEITELTGRQKTLVEFIYSLVGDKLDGIRQEAQTVIDRLKKAYQEEETLKRIEGELKSLEQDVADLSRQLEAREKVQDELQKHRAAQEAKRYVGSLKKETLEIVERINNLTDEWESGPAAASSRLDEFTQKNVLIQAEEKVSRAYSELVKSLRESLRTFQEKIDLALDKHPDWAKVQTAISRAEKNFAAACREKGLTPQEAEHLKEIELQHRAKKTALQAKKAERAKLVKEKSNIPELFAKLTKCWVSESSIRKEFLEQIIKSETMPRTSTDMPIIAHSLEYAGNREAFLEAWGELTPDRRTAEGRIWDNYYVDNGENNIGDRIFKAFRDYIENNNSPYRAGNPVQWLELFLDNPDDLPDLVEEHLEVIKKVRKEKYDSWFKLLVKRTPDSVDLQLYRHDGTIAGSFVKGDLSTGQKNTAILSLLLAAGGGPVLIDQPEDQLDSEFLFHELVPMMRSAREKRQLIIVTHNANIPVNADAELVYALEARDGRGKKRTQGGLDRSETAKAVLDIMEGSEEAFRRRKEKYHF